MTGKLCALLVEDEVINAMILTSQLEAEGFFEKILHVTSGEEAVHAAENIVFDLVLMDIGLAGKMDGIEAAAIIKSKADTPVVFITGYDDEAIRKKAEPIFPLGYLIKPLDFEILKEIIVTHFSGLTVTPS